jgi:histone deacetylase HOS3
MYTSTEHWEKLYAEQYSKILRKAEEFLDSTGGPGNDILVFIRSFSFLCLHVLLNV